MCVVQIHSLDEIRNIDTWRQLDSRRKEDVDLSDELLSNQYLAKGFNLTIYSFLVEVCSSWHKSWYLFFFDEASIWFVTWLFFFLLQLSFVCSTQTKTDYNSDDRLYICTLATVLKYWFYSCINTLDLQSKQEWNFRLGWYTLSLWFTWVSRLPIITTILS